MMSVIDNVECYGTLIDSSNFHVICEDEEDDFVWLTRDSSKLRTWNDIVKHLKGKGINVIEISAI